MDSSQEQFPKEMERNRGESSDVTADKANMDISQEQRRKIIVKMLLSILQRRDIQLIRDARIDEVIPLVEKIENEIFMEATSYETYKKLLVTRIKYLRSQLNDCFLKKRKTKVVETKEQFSKERSTDADLEKLITDVQSVKLSDSDTKEVPVILSEEDADERSHALVGRGPDGIPVMRNSCYSSSSVYLPAEFERPNKNKRSADFENCQPSAFIKTSNKVPVEDVDISMFEPVNNLNDPFKVDNFDIDLDFLLEQPESPESRKIVDELSEKVCGRNRNLSAMSASPASSFDSSVSSPQSTSTESEYWDPRGWSASFSPLSSASDDMVFPHTLQSSGTAMYVGSPASPSSVTSTTSSCPSSVYNDDQRYKDVLAILREEAREIDMRKSLTHPLNPPPTTLSPLSGFLVSAPQQQQQQQQQHQFHEDQQQRQLLQQQQLVQQQQKQQLLPKPQPQQQPFRQQPTQPICVLPVYTAIATSPVVTISLTQQKQTKSTQRPILPKPSSPATTTTTKGAQLPKNIQAPSPKRSSAITTNVSPSSQLKQTSTKPSIDHYAMACRKVAQLAVEQLTTQDKDGDTPLMICACRGDPATVEAICERSQREPHTEIINQKNRMDQTALLLAVAENNPPIVEILVKYRANVNLAGRVKERDVEDRLAPIHIACKHGDVSLAVLQALLQSPDIDLHIQTREEGMTALHLATKMHGNINNCGKRIDSKCIVQELIRAGARADFPEEKSGKTPLHLAVESMDNELVKCMVDSMPCGVVEALNKPMFNGNTCLHIAAGLQKGNALSLNQQKSIIDTLLRKGAVRDVPNALHQRPYNFASHPDIEALLRGNQSRPLQGQRFLTTPNTHFHSFLSDVPLSSNI